jgi:hypothetical protein
MKNALSQNKSTIVFHSGNLYRSESDRTILGYSVTSRVTFQNSDVIFIWMDISNCEKNLRGLHQIYDLSAMLFVLSVEIMASNKT